MSGIEIKPSLIPFTPSSCLVGETWKTTVYGYESQQLVVKLLKLGCGDSFPAAESAIERIRQDNKHREDVLEALQVVGGSAELVPAAKSVIYNDESGRVAVARTQRWFKGASTLKELGLGVLSLPNETLTDIKYLFTANCRLWTESRQYIDIHGYLGESRYGVNGMRAKVMTPLFNSSNILVGTQGEVRFIDVEQPGTVPDILRFKLLPPSPVIGSRLSAGIIDIVLGLRKLRVLPNASGEPVKSEPASAAFEGVSEAV